MSVVVLLMPWLRNILIFCANASWLVVARPPSAVVMIFTG